MWNPLSWVMEGAALVAIALSNGGGRVSLHFDLLRSHADSGRREVLHVTDSPVSSHYTPIFKMSLLFEIIKRDSAILLCHALPCTHK